MNVAGIHYNRINHRTVNKLMNAKMSEVENNGQSIKENEVKGINKNSVKVHISDEGRQLYNNSITKEEPLNKAGQTHKREEWEQQDWGFGFNRYDKSGNYQTMYLMYLDSPETYAKWEDANLRAGDIYDYHDYGDKIVVEVTEENLKAAKAAAEERDRIKNEWYNEKGKYLKQQLASLSPIDQKMGNPIEALEKKYSDIHDLSIGIYCNENQDERAHKLNYLYTGSSLWRNPTKFNIMITAEMFRKMVGDNEQEKEDVLKRIDIAAKNMKEIEKNYEGDKEVLRFGVKFRTDGSVTYHANYKGCDDAWGITAEGANQLLEKLND